MYTTQPGIKTLRKQQWDAEQKRQKTQRAQANAAAHAKVIASLHK